MVNALINNRNTALNNFYESQYAANIVHYSFEHHPWNNNGAVRYVDERTGLTGYWFDGNTWLNTGSTFGTPFTFAFFAKWNDLNSWSRIVDFGTAADRDNILIANEGGSRHFAV